MSTISIAIGQTPAAASTTLAAASNAVRLPLVNGTITVASATAFPSSGSILVLTDEGFQEVAYTGTTSTTFTGCTGGVGVMYTGVPVKTPAEPSSQGGQQPSAPVINVGLDVSPGSDYTAGGYTFDPAAELQALAGYDKAPVDVAVLSEKKLVSAHVYEWSYDRVNGLLWLIKDGAADAGTADLSAIGAIRVLIMAR